MSSKSKNIDSRALNEDEIALFEEGGFLHPFVELVKKHKKDLQLCFRGNEDTKSVIIYYNNRQVYKIYCNGKVEISFRTARYYKKCKEKYDLLVKEYHFVGEETFECFLEKGNYSLTKMVKENDDFEKIYIEVLRPILKNYAKNEEIIDYFKLIIEEKKQTRNHEEKEKKAQQRLFRQIKTIKSGYFFYDLEFHQTISEKKNININDANKNEPDILGIYFDDDRKPEKLVFVEVKSKEESLGDMESFEGSGLMAHLYKTYKYCKHPELINNRTIEACGIINNYAALKLRGLNERNHFDVEDFNNISLQALFLFTDEVKDYINNNLEEYAIFQGREIDIKNPDCRAYAFNKDDMEQVIQRAQKNRTEDKR